MTDSITPLRILVPCDFSHACRQALETCVAFDWSTSVKIFLLTVEDLVKTGHDNENSDHWLAAFRARLSFEITVCPLVGKGRFIRAVLEAVTLQEIDLIVVGTRGARGMGRSIPGIARGKHCPYRAGSRPFHSAAISFYRITRHCCSHRYQMRCCQVGSLHDKAFGILASKVSSGICSH